MSTASPTPCHASFNRKKRCASRQVIVPFRWHCSTCRRTWVTSAEKHTKRERERTGAYHPDPEKYSPVEQRVCLLSLLQGSQFPHTRASEEEKKPTSHHEGSRSFVRAQCAIRRPARPRGTGLRNGTVPCRRTAHMAGSRWNCEARRNWGLHVEFRPYHR